jgi:hypothetical protein
MRAKFSHNYPGWGAKLRANTADSEGRALMRQAHLILVRQQSHLRRKEH